MSQNTFVTNEAPVINLSVNGELFLKGWDRKEVSALADHSNMVKVKQDGDILNIFSVGDCEISVPAASVLQVERVGGEASFTDLNGSLTVQRVGGDLSMLRVGTVHVVRVGGDLNVQQVGGELSMDKSGGDFTGRDLDAAVLIQRAGGDITLQDVIGPVKAHASGDIRMSLASVAECMLRAGGDIGVHIPQGANLTLKINSSGHDITLVYGDRSETIDDRYFEGNLGEGGPELVLEAGGDVMVTDQPWDGETLAGFGKNFTDRGMNFDRVMSEGIRRGMRSVNSVQIAEQIARRTEEAARRAEQRVQSAMNRVEWSVGRRSRWDNVPPVPPTPPTPPGVPTSERQPVTNDERLMVLKMVQEKKISVEEADKLLRALEGRYE